jgi:radical SAM protein (TIGR01212 family)
MGFISSRYKTSHFIAYFQSYTNTYGPLDQLERLYLEALSFPEVVGLAIGTRPDCVSDQVIDLLAKLNSEKLIWVELGLQSMHDRTLRLINRGHDFSVFAEATARLMEKGLNVVAHLILGLPGESLSDMINTARAVSDLGVSGVKLHPLYVVRGSGLEQLYVQGLYEPMTMEQTTGVTLEVVRHIDPKVVIHRLTSDPHREELLAPEWMLDRKAVRAFLDSEMDRTDFRQGSAL